MNNYGQDKEYLNSKGFHTLELKQGDAAILVAPGLQGRVMTSTAKGDKGNSYGWINCKFIDEGRISGSFNPYGGEERFWIGPEGGPNSWYFAPGVPQTFQNWRVPAGIDTEPFEIESNDGKAVTFIHSMDWTNASGRRFRIGVRRRITLLDRKELAQVLGTDIPDNVAILGYRTENTLVNNGDNAWNKDTGMPSVWLLGSFNPTPTTTVFIPFNKKYEGKAVNDGYFGKVPSDRLVLDNGMAYFKIDGKFRSKIGLPKGSAKDICGSYDSEKKVLNILKYTVPLTDDVYVNSQWGEQEDPYCGDVINSYNDGPNETGGIMGPFYEIETSSPGAALAPGASITHTQYTVHIEGEEKDLALLCNDIFGADLAKISGIFIKE